ncbi:MAG: hypothetical protein IJ597_04540 [Synergistaceae bacterium]|nr:hypothetical protein [Synergistaceae bacterium]
MKKFLVAFLVVVMMMFVSVAYADTSPTITTTQLPKGSVRLDNATYVIDNVVGVSEINKDKKEAREKAKRLASQNALKILINEFPILKSIENKIISNTQKLIKNFSITNETIEQDGKFHVSGTCKIDEKALEKLIFPDVIKILGNPRIMLIFDEKVGGKAQTSGVAQKETKRLLEKAGYAIVTPEQARPVISADVSKIVNDPTKLYDVARTLRADAIIIGNASAAAFATKKYLGATFYGVSGSVQLKVIITQNSMEFSSQKFSASTGRNPAGSLGEGASRCLTPSASKAVDQILYKVAYSIASSGANTSESTINIKIANILFNDVEKIEKQLRELAGANGEMFERAYKDNVLEIVFTSNKKAREVASFLSERGFTVKALTNWSINADMFSDKKPDFVPQDKIIAVSILDVPSFKKSGELENLLNNFVLSHNGKLVAQYHDNKLELALQMPNEIDASEFSKKVASFLEENSIEIEGASPSFVNGKLKKEEEIKSPTLFW